MRREPATQWVAWACVTQLERPGEKGHQHRKEPRPGVERRGAGRGVQVEGEPAGTSLSTFAMATMSRLLPSGSASPDSSGPDPSNRDCRCSPEEPPQVLGAPAGRGDRPVQPDHEGLSAVGGKSRTKPASRSSQATRSKAIPPAHPAPEPAAAGTSLGSSMRREGSNAPRRPPASFHSRVKVYSGVSPVLLASLRQP